ncbi:MAG: carboxylesterase family protein, partial [bacterium]
MKPRWRWVVGLVIVCAIGWGIWRWQSRPESLIAVADPATERMTNNGKVIGFSEKNGSHAWLGIPYAIPPVGTLRWKAPLPAGRRTETLQALQVGSFCSQIGNPSITVKDDLMGQPVGSEDCLFLNIWAPRLTMDQIRQGDVRLPVMFWLHGGGNSIGHGGNYPGRTLAVRHNLIVVTI